MRCAGAIARFMGSIRSCNARRPDRTRSPHRPRLRRRPALACGAAPQFRIAAADRLGRGMLEELATWRQQYPHDAVVHAFGRDGEAPARAAGSFGRKLQEMHASFAMGDTPEAAAGSTEDAGARHGGDDHPHKPPAEGSEAPDLAGAHGVTPQSLQPGVSMSVLGDAEGAVPRPADAAEAPRRHARDVHPSEPPDDTPPAGTASHGTPAQDLPGGISSAGTGIVIRGTRLRSAGWSRRGSGGPRRRVWCDSG